jgi:hypothetical protein
MLIDAGIEGEFESNAFNSDMLQQYLRECLPMKLRKKKIRKVKNLEIGSYLSY